MKKVLQVAKREVQRFRTRFSGGSRLVILLIVIIALLVSYLVAQQGLVMGKGLYTVGVSPGGPAITDPRFNVQVLNYSDGIQMLDSGSIDLYMDGETAFSRNDLRSQYAEGALKQYLDKAQLTSFIEQYNINQSFPLRIEVEQVPQATVAPVTSAPVATVVASQPSITAVPATASGPSTVNTSAAVEQQIAEFENGSSSKFKAEFVSDNEIIIPSLMNPPIPLSQVILAFLYIMPVMFMSIFFNSSFMEEKTNRKLNVLMSTPVTPFDVIAGKMLPYVVFSLITTVAITVFLGGNILLALAIFLPVILFIFAIYLMVSLVYRTFKDQTFFSMAAITFVTGYLVLPALFTGINDVSYISPLTLAVQMYRGQSFGLLEYVLSTGPMYVVFAISMFVGVRIFNEEYLMGYGTLFHKLADAIYLSLNKNHLYISIALVSLLIIPAVYMVELIVAILSLMIPVSSPMVFLAILLALCVIIEEVAKSLGILTLIENKKVTSMKMVLFLSAASAIGFFIGEKAMLYLSLSVVSNVMLIDALGGAGLLLIPLVAHFIFTSVVCLPTKKFGTKYYPVMLFAGGLLHFIFDFAILASQMGMLK
jgi:ABC-type Na+ efflux pump permease subunit